MSKKQTSHWQYPYHWIISVDHSNISKELREKVCNETYLQHIQSRQNNYLFNETDRDIEYMDKLMDSWDLPDEDKLRIGSIINDLCCRYIDYVVEQTILEDTIKKQIGEKKYNQCMDLYLTQLKKDREEDAKIHDEILKLFPN
ncbi:MAG: hypothetical protein K6A23_13900 [Butyrivibrio sp.]|nr:hypothetical protein [Butyrivibrio sp.]